MGGGDIVSLKIQGAELTPTVKMPNSSSTILELKHEIQKETGVDVARQNLWAEVELEDNRTMASYGLDTFCSVRLCARPLLPETSFKVTVVMWSFMRAEREYEVRESNTVLELKKMVENHFDAVAADMKMYLWHGHEEMKNDKSLAKYYVHDGSKLSVWCSKMTKKRAGKASSSKKAPAPAPGMAPEA